MSSVGVHTKEVPITNQATPVGFFASLGISPPAAQCFLIIQVKSGQPPKLVDSTTNLKGPYVASAREGDSVFAQGDATLQFYGGWDEFYLYAPQDDCVVALTAMPLTAA